MSSADTVKLADVLREAKRQSGLTGLTERGLRILRKEPIWERGIMAIWLPNLKLWAGWPTPKKKGASSDETDVA